MYEFLPIGYMLRGRYRVLRVIGGGGMGAVYKSEDTRRGGSLVAVKEMRTDIDTPGSAHASETEEDRIREREERRQLLEAFRREAQIVRVEFCQVAAGASRANGSAGSARVTMIRCRPAGSRSTSQAKAA